LGVDGLIWLINTLQGDRQELEAFIIGLLFADTSITVESAVGVNDGYDWRVVFRYSPTQRCHFQHLIATKMSEHGRFAGFA
jgi:hypothetical protein